MASQPNQDGRESILDDRGNVQGYRSTFADVKLVAVQETELHRTLEADRTVTTVELPGLVNLYAEINGGRVLLDQLKAPVVLEAIDKAKQAASESAAQPSEAPPASQ